MRAFFNFPRVCFAGLLLLAMLSAAVRARPGYNLAVGDTFFIEPRPAAVIERDLYLWADTNGGIPSTNAIQLPYRLGWVLAEALGLAPWQVQAIERGLFLVTAGLAMFLLARGVWPGRAWAPVGASAFYMFNVGRLLLELIVHLEWLYVLLPLMLALYVRMNQLLWAGNAGAGLRRGLALAALVGLAFPVVLINLPQAVVVAGALAAGAGGMMLLAPRGQRARTFGVHALIGGASAVLSAWWLWPTVQYYVLSLPQGEVAAVTDAVAWSWTHLRSSFLNELVLTPQWSWGPEHVPVFTWYELPLMRLLVLAPGLLSVGAIWAARGPRERRTSLWLVAGLLLLLFLGKGLHTPGSQLNELAYRYLPGMWLLREPWGKLFGFVALVVALLVGLGLDGLLARWVRLSRWPPWPALAALPLLGLFPLAVWPLFAPSVLYRASTVLPSPQIRIPDYWFEVDELFADDGEVNRVLLAPGDTFYAVPYTWGGYFADSLPDRALPSGIVSRDFNYVTFNAGYAELIEAIYSALEDPAAAADPTQAMALLNVRYVLVRGDVAERQLPLTSSTPDSRLELLGARLAALPGLELFASAGPLQFYRLKDAHFVPRIYVPEEVKGLEAAGELVTQPAQPSKLPVHLAPEDAQRVPARAPDGCQVRLAFEVVNPTRYQVEADSDCREYLLVIGTGYDVNWRATVRPWGLTAGTGRIVPESDYLRANGYAGAWRIQQTGRHTIVIEYRPQQVFGWSVWASMVGVAVGGLGLYLSFRPLHARAAKAAE